MLSLINAPPLINPLPPKRDAEQIVQHLPLSLTVPLDGSLHLDPSALMTNNRKTCAINYCVVCNNAPPLINAPIRDGEQIVWLLPQSLVVHLIGSPLLDPSALMTNNRKTCAINYYVVANKCSPFHKSPPPYKGWWADTSPASSSVSHSAAWWKSSPGSKCPDDK